MDLEVLYSDPPMITGYHSEDGSEVGVFAPFAIDHESEHIYFVKVMLSDYNLEAKEYSFCIMRRDRINDTTIEYWSGRDTSELFDNDTKEFIRTILQNLSYILISKYNPEVVFRETYDVNPPDKALDKHNMISQFFGYLGYEVRNSDVYKGQQCWVMRKVANTDEEE
ncbi:hypothetical protein [Terasakiella pusilla]|uniref:hypothetical protein n=1 Tax=Terasakiella pusilla TaxID=64973 RepID=UPI003AA7E57D